MVASRLRQPKPALPDPNERNDPRDRTRRRAADRAQTAGGRQPRTSLDSLAIGAPLTVALVGVLLTEGDAAVGQGGVGSSSGGGSAARHGTGEAGTTERSAPAAGHDAAGEGAALAAASGSTSGEIFDPIAATDAAALNSAPSGGGTGNLAPPAAVSAAIGAQAALFGDINIALGTGASLEDGLGLNSGSDAGAGASSGRIGTTIVGTDGDDIIHGTPYDDRLFGGPGNDTIYGYEGDDLLDGGPGNDSLFGGPGNDRLFGGSGNDLLSGGTGDDSLFGGAGRDRLFGDEGRDWLDGGSGNDLVDGGPGADRMTGGTGNDRLVVDNMHDVALEYGRGPDGGGQDTLEIGAGFVLPDGTATFVFSENFGAALPSGAAPYSQQVGSEIEHLILRGNADYDVLGDSGANQLTGNAGDNRLYGNGGDDILIGGGGDDHLFGGSGRDRLEGGNGADFLHGGSGADELYGGDGDDILAGGTGADRLYGGAGNDNFVIGLNDSAVDTVFDHEGRNWLTIEDGAAYKVQTAVAGDQLYVVVDNYAAGVVDGYLGNEGAFAGIDSGAGLRTIDDLMAPGAGHGPALGGATTGAAATFQDDLLGAYLTRPSLQGTAGADYLLGTSDPDWLRGGAGDDHLVGGDGRDVLEGEAGRDLLEGGGGDDRYLFKWGDGSWDVIHDTEGANVVQLDGVARTNLAAVVSGKNLVVVADNLPVFTFEDFVGHEQAFAGLQIGDEILSADDLLS